MCDLNCRSKSKAAEPVCSTACCPDCKLFGSYKLFLSTAAFMSPAAATWCRVRSRCVRSRGVGSRGVGSLGWTRCAGAGHCCMAGAGPCPVGMGNCCPAVGRTAASAIGNAPRSAVVASSAFAHKAMAAPAVAVAPSAPWTHPQEDAVVEVPWPVVTIGRAGIRRIAVVAVCTAWLNADVNHKLRLSHWRQGQAGEKCRCTE